MIWPSRKKLGLKYNSQAPVAQEAKPEVNNIPQTPQQLFAYPQTPPKSALSPKPKNSIIIPSCEPKKMPDKITP